MKNLLLGLTVCMVMFSCSDSNGGKKTKESYQALIDSMETERTKYFQEGKMPPKELVLQSVQAFEFFSADYPKDEKAAERLFEAAKRYEIDLQDYNNSVRLYQKVYDEYEGYEHHAMALFHIGNAYHSAKDTESAKAKFNEFIEKYPEHDFADDAAGMINIIDMGGEEEFLRRVLEQAEKDSVAS